MDYKGAAAPKKYTLLCYFKSSKKTYHDRALLAIAIKIYRFFTIISINIQKCFQ